MKTRVLKDYGTCGIEIKLNLADQMQVNHAIDRIDATIKKWEEDCVFDTLAAIEDFRVIRVFLKKLALEDSAKPTIFDEEVPETQEPKK